MKKVYLLQHAYEYGKNFEHTESKIIGIYESRIMAENAIRLYKKLPGFIDYSEECFYIDEYELNVGSWSEGFFNACEK